jgi:hypothetical protein
VNRIREEAEPEQANGVRFALVFEKAAVGARGYRNAVIWIADAHRNDRRRFVTHADDKLTTFLELETPGAPSPDAPLSAPA